MIRGVSFKITPSRYVLREIFKCINVENYCWYNIEGQNEVWSNYFGGIALEKDYYNGKDFLQQINTEHNIIFLKLQAYFENGDFFNIHTFEAFQKSDCQLLLLMYDCISVEIFAKDQLVIKAIYKNVFTNEYTNVEYINEVNDGRTKMDIL